MPIEALGSNDHEYDARTYTASLSLDEHLMGPDHAWHDYNIVVAAYCSHRRVFQIR
jgi:hypothetical protein